MSFIYNNNWHESQRAYREEEKTYPTDPNPPNYSSDSSGTSQWPATASSIAPTPQCIHHLRIFSGILSSPSFGGESSLSLSEIIGSGDRSPADSLGEIALDVGRSG